MADRLGRFWWVLVCIIAEILCYDRGNVVYGGGSTFNSQLDTVCGGNCTCVQWNEDATVQYYHYHPSLKVCQALPTSCDVPDSCGKFSSLDICQRVCHRVGGCASSRWGCCPDGETPRDEDGKNCPKGEEEKDAHSSSGIRWDLVASGICATVILLGVISLIGVATYAYRHQTKQRQRSRYIQEILQMYNSTGASDSSTESSYFSDNPEHNNLFDRL